MLAWNVDPQPPGIRGPWFLWKLLIDHRHQRLGYGHEVMRLIVDLIRSHGATELLTSYGLGDGSPVGFYEGLSASSVSSSSSTFLFLEEAAPQAVNHDSTNDSYHDPRNDRVTGRHRGGANFALCDGHVSYLKTNAVRFPNPNGDPRFEP